MENPRETLCCRKCRKGFIDSTCLYPIPSEGTASQCSVWHVNIDTMPVWILTSVQQAQWTVGKLNCQNCGARLGGFNFLGQSRCLCGQEDGTVHLSKSRMDSHHHNSVPVVQPGRWPEHGQALQSKQQRADHNRDSVFWPQLDLTAESRLNHDAIQTVTPRAGTSDRLSDRDVAHSRHFKARCCKPHRKRLEGNPSTNSAPSSCSILSQTQVEAGTEMQVEAGPETQVEAGPETQVEAGPEAQVEAGPGAEQSAQVSSDATGPLIHGAACHSTVFRERRSQQQTSAAEDLAFPGTVTSHASDSASFPRGRSTSDSVGEQQEEEMLEAPSSAEPNGLSKMERNRLKSQRRKQRKRERWMLKQQEQRWGGRLTDGEEEDGEGYICAVCLDVYYSPYSCQPCGHVFCEPCLRTLAKSRTSATPCPLCRTRITHTLCEKELNQKIKTLFPKVYHARKENFQNTPYAKWPLPNSRRQRNPAQGRRWHYTQAGFTLDPLDIMFLATIFFTYFFFS